MLPVKENSDEGLSSVSANSRRDISLSSTPSSPQVPCLPGREQSNGQGPAPTAANGLPNGEAQLPQGQRMPVSAFAARAGIPDASLSAKQMQMALGGGQPAGIAPTIPAL